VEFTYNKPLKIKGNIVNRLDASLSKVRQASIIKNTTDNGFRYLTYLINDEISGNKLDLMIDFVISKDEVFSTSIKSFSEGDKDLNEYDLKNYIISMYQDVLLSENNEDFNSYTIRVYASIFNASKFKGEIEINYFGKVLLKCFDFPDKHEPLTEHIVLFDVEVNAVNLEHARSIAFNKVKEICSVLSLLLDVGFKFLFSEFKHFILKDGEKFSIKRYRTGFIDTDLNLVVKDNMNGLKHAADEDDLSNFFSGKISTRMFKDNDPSLEMLDQVTYDTTSKVMLEEVFKKHKIKRDKSNSIRPIERIKKSKHMMNDPIMFPRCTKTLFRELMQMNVEKRSAILSCAYMYNISLVKGDDEPTLCASYLVCAIESLGLYSNLKFSPFLNQYSEDNYDKGLTDYFYRTVRSGHFHSGKLLFNECSINFQTDHDFLFVEKQDQMHGFYNIARGALVKWLEDEVLA
tara:strand:+ start:1414 stop:2793 length:1380 start_codon:yes stop_codon:yes gene_type:complete